MKTIITFLVIISLSMGYMRAQTTGTTPVDGNGNTYSWVKIGEQHWMSENLRTTKFANGDDIPTGFTNAEWIVLLDKETNTGTPAYASYPDAVTADGLLYNWFAATDSRGICPEGWKVPSDEDWKELEVFAGMEQATADLEGWRHTDKEAIKLKSTTRSFGEAIDNFGFSALPSGHREKTNGTYAQYNIDAYFWATTIVDPEDPNLKFQGRRRLLRNSYNSINRSGISKTAGQSIRCIKSSLTSLPSINNELSTIESEAIYCLSGKKVYCSIENLPHGIYVKKIRYENGYMETKKFVVNK